MPEQQTSTQYSLPPEYLQQFLAGGAAGAPGLFPLMNRAMVDQFANMGTPGATPYTYQGDRIAGFSPRELAAFELGDQAIGSYLPFLQRQEGLYERGIGEGAAGAAAERDYTQRGIDMGLGGIGESTARLRALQPQQELGFQRAEDYMRGGAGEILGGAGQAEMLSRTGLNQTLGGLARGERRGLQTYGQLGRQLGQAGAGDFGENVAGTARGVLGQAGRYARGATGTFDPASGISAYMDPYEQDVVQQTIRDIEEAQTKGDIGRRGSEISQGAFGGSRGRLAQEESDRALGRGLGESIGALRSQGYQGARQAAMEEFARGKGAQAGAAAQYGNMAGALGSLAGQQATGGQNLANMLADYGGRAGSAFQNLGATMGNLGQMRGGALTGYGQNIANLTGQRTGLGQNIATGIGNLGQAGANLMMGGGQQLGGVGQRMAGMYGGYGDRFGGMGQQLGQLQRGDIGLLGSIGGAQRGMDQSINDLAYQNFTGQYNLPMQLLGQYSNIAQGIAPMAGGMTSRTTTQPGIDYFSSGLGGLASAMGQQ